LPGFIYCDGIEKTIGSAKWPDCFEGEKVDNLKPYFRCQVGKIVN